MSEFDVIIGSEMSYTYYGFKYLSLTGICFLIIYVTKNEHYEYCFYFPQINLNILHENHKLTYTIIHIYDRTRTSNYYACIKVIVQYCVEMFYDRKLLQ